MMSATGGSGAGTSGVGEPGGGDAGLHRIGYRYRLLLHVLALRACRLVRARGYLGRSGVVILRPEEGKMHRKACIVLARDALPELGVKRTYCGHRISVLIDPTSVPCG
jgi:hypothetical protein